MNALLQDLRFAVRVLLRNGGFTAIAVLTLALGIGANAAVFTLFKSLVVRPVPFPEPERLVRLWEESRGSQGYVWGSVSMPNLRDWREMNAVLESVAAYFVGGFHLTGDKDPVRVLGARVEPELFDVLGVKPALGRAFLADEDEPGKGRVVVLSHGLWKSRFAGDPEIVGKTIGIDGAAHVVVGVMPPEFSFPVWSNARIWMPLVIVPDVFQHEARGTHWLDVLGRLKPGVSLAAARENLNSVAKRIEETYPSQRGRGVLVRTFFEATFGKTAGILIVLWGAVGFVLLIACANVASMLLARATERRREIAVRLALGASRWRVTRLVLVESLVLALVGGALGLLAAPWTLDLLASVEGNPIARERVIAVDSSVWVFCAIASAVAAAICGLVPALQSSRTNVVHFLKDGSEGHGFLERWRRSFWVVGETSLALALLVGAGLIAKSIYVLTRVDPGFNTENLLTMRISLPPTKYAEPQRRIRFYDELQARVEALPGVRAAGMANMLPIQSCWSNGTFSVRGRPAPAPGEGPLIEHRLVSPGFFAAMGIPVASGRALESRDRGEGTKSTVISQRAAKRFWGEEEPVGQSMSIGSVVPEGNWKTIVGVVDDVPCAGVHLPPRPVMYEPYWQLPPEEMSLVVRSEGPPESLVPAIRRAVLEIDPDQPVYLVKTMEQILSDAAVAIRFVSFVVGLFTALALALATVGVYGVLSFVVSRSTREIGLRLALGAQRGQVLLLVMKRGLGQVLLGIAVGIPLALAGTGVLRALVEGVLAPDVWTVAAAVAVLLLAGLAASYLPARRAANVAPMDALRYE